MRSVSGRGIHDNYDTLFFPAQETASLVTRCGLQMIRLTVDTQDTGLRIDAWLARQPAVGSRGRALRWIERGKVMLNDDIVGYADAGRRIHRGDRISVWVDRPGSSLPPKRGLAAASPALHIVYEDRALVVADKPAGLLVEPLPGREDDEITLLDLVANHLKASHRSRPLVVHRIDRDTSGLVIFARTPTAQQILKDQFRRHTAERRYLTLLRGRVEPDKGTWRDRLVWDSKRLVQRRAHPRETRAREAVANYRVIEQFSSAALVEVFLATGKRNQIRVQTGLRGHPVVGERIYLFGATQPVRGEPTLARQALHAAGLTLTHPATRERLTFSAPVPDDMRRLLGKLRKIHPCGGL